MNINGALLIGAGHGSGVVATVSAIWDHWDGDGFRLPVYLGGGVMSISEQADLPGVGMKRTADVTSPALLVGASPAFNIWKFRAVTYFMITAAFDPGRRCAVLRPEVIARVGRPVQIGE